MLFTGRLRGIQWGFFVVSYAVVLISLDSLVSLDRDVQTGASQTLSFPSIVLFSRDFCRCSLVVFGIWYAVVLFRLVSLDRGVSTGASQTLSFTGTVQFSRDFCCCILGAFGGSTGVSSGFYMLLCSSGWFHWIGVSQRVHHKSYPSSAQCCSQQTSAVVYWASSADLLGFLQGFVCCCALQVGSIALGCLNIALLKGLLQLFTGRLRGIDKGFYGVSYCCALQVGFIVLGCLTRCITNPLLHRHRPIRKRLLQFLTGRRGCFICMCALQGGFIG